MSASTSAAPIPATVVSQRGIARQSPEQHGDALGRERVGGLAQQPGQRVVELAVVHGVAELVQHRLGPPLVGLDVAQDAHVTLAVDVDAEGVLALSFARRTGHCGRAQAWMSRPRPS